MRISDWSSDVCSSDLQVTNVAAGTQDTDAVNLEQLQEVAKTADNTDYFFKASDDPDTDSVGAYVEGASATAAGEAASAIGFGATAFGSGAMSLGELATASGSGEVASQKGSVAYGVGSQADRKSTRLNSSN